MPEEWLAVSWKPSGYGAVAAAAAALHVVLYGGVMAAGRQPGDKSVAVVSRRISRRERRRSLAEVAEDLSQRAPRISRRGRGARRGKRLHSLAFSAISAR